MLPNLNAKMRLPYATGSVRVTSPFGKRMLNGVETNHKGLDLVGSNKTLVAPCDGVIGASGIVTNKADRTWEWGNFVRIDTNDGLMIFMCHMSERKVKVGDKVKAGDVVGIEGATGYAFGSHCHFEIRNSSGISLNPAAYLGVKNGDGSYGVPKEASKSYADLVCEKCGLETQTRTYIDKYKYADALWKKLWEAMK